MLITILAALIPSVLLVWYFHSRDHRPEPWRAIAACFGLAILSVVPVVLADWPIAAALARLRNPALAGPAEAFLVAAIPEEFFKFAVLYWYACRRRWFDEPMDGIVYGAIVSLGFATLENLLYSLQGGLAVALARAVLSVPGHAFWGAIMGYYVGLAHFGPPAARRRLLAGALAWPMLLHGIYDTPILTLKQYAALGEPSADVKAVLGLLLLVSLATIIVSAVAGIRLVRRLRQAQAVALAAQGVLPAGVRVPAAVSPQVLAIAALWPKAPLAAVPADAAAIAPGAMPATAGEVGRVPALSLPPPPSRPIAWVLLIVGGLGSTLAGLVLLAATAALIGGKSANPVHLIVGTVIIGVLPLVLCAWLFRKGLRRLPRPASAQRTS
jgi:RsiW-degrading membrane proteinase PrsW (M82 family)